MLHQKAFEYHSLAYVQEGQLFGGKPYAKGQRGSCVIQLRALPTQHPHKLNYEQIKGIQTEHSNSGNLNK